MSDGITIKFDQDEFRKKIDNFLGHAFIEFFQNPPDDVMYEIHEYLATVFNPYVPIDTGELADSVDWDSDAIYYNTPYAHYVYEGEVYGPNIPIIKDGEIVRWVSPKGQTKYPTGKSMQYQNPLATRHWDETAISDNWDSIEQRVRDIIITAWNNQ